MSEQNGSGSPPTYREFLATKARSWSGCGREVKDDEINTILYPFQRDITKWAIRKGRSAIFADTGLGKTFMQLEWARLISDGPALIVAPLSVARQTAREARKIGLDVQYSRDGTLSPLTVTNYEMIDRFDPARIRAIVLDESSILKALDGKTRRKLTEMFSAVPYRLCCTATPAPNDLTEIGNHAEFLGICSSAEMRAMFFINANKEHTFIQDGKSYRKKGSNDGGQEWRLKRPAEQPFFRWLSSWAISLMSPADLGYNDDRFCLPPLTISPQFVGTDIVSEGQLLFTHLHGLGDRADIRRKSLPARLESLIRLVAASTGQWIVWTGLDVESRAATEALPDAVEVTGSDSPEKKAEAFEAFQDGKYRCLVTKGRVGGFGMNFQNASHMAFLGLNDSWETWYQCIRREWRYGQTEPVTVHVIMSDVEAEIYHNVLRKDAMATRLRRGLIAQIKHYEEEELNTAQTHIQDEQTGPGWTLKMGDSCERLKELGNDSIALSVYSPPFADLYTYSNSPRDLGNSTNWQEFFIHYRFIVREVFRVTQHGRLSCVHVSDIPAMSQKDGYIGVKDFPGEVIRAHQSEGWVFHGRAFVQKNPQAQAIRTHSQALLFVQLSRDSAKSRPALIDQVLIFKKPGDNAVPVKPVENGELDNETWIEWAHGIWLGIQESNTLQFGGARDTDDEKHICPLQLGTIERCVKLYSNRGDMVLSPFAGIGSEGYVSLLNGRQFVGVELKDTYFHAATKNLQRAIHERDSQLSLLAV